MDKSDHYQKKKTEGQQGQVVGLADGEGGCHAHDGVVEGQGDAGAVGQTADQTDREALSDGGVEVVESVGLPTVAHRDGVGCG